MASVAHAFAWRPMPGPLEQRLASAAGWSIAGMIVARLAALGGSVAIARILGVQSFGELSIIQNTVGMFGSLTSFGLALTATKHVAQYRDTDPARASRIITLSNGVAWVAGGVMTLAMLPLCGWMAHAMLAAPHVAVPLRECAPLILFSAIAGAQTGVLSGMEAFRASARLSVLTGFLTSGFQVGGVWLGGLRGSVWGLVLGTAAACVVGHMVQRPEMRRRGLRFDWPNCWQEAGMLFRFSLPVLISALIVSPANWFCAMALVKQPGGYGELGLFNAAMQWRQAITLVPWTVSIAIAPIFVNVLAEKNRVRAACMVRYQLFLCMGITVAIALPMIVAARWIMSLYGGQFAGGASILIVSSITAILVSLGNSQTRFIQSFGKAWSECSTTLAWGAVLLLSTVILVPRYFGMGLAAANLLAIVVQLLWQTHFLRRALSRL